MKQTGSAQRQLRKQIGKDATTILRQVEKMQRDRAPRANIEKELVKQLSHYLGEAMNKIDYRFIVPVNVPGR